MFLSVVIPAYNEQGRIVPTLNKVVGYLSERQYTWEVIVVDDGSTDDTVELVRQVALKEPRVRIEVIEHAGKGWAVRHGMLVATGEYRYMCDADLATPIEQLEQFLDKISNGYDVVIGSRQIDGAQRYDEPIMRHLMGRAFNWTVSALCVGGFKDTQCGFKLFRGESARALFSLQTIRGFAFDVEVLYLAKKNRIRVFEMPVVWRHNSESKVRAGLDAFLMARDALRIRIHSLRGGYKAGRDVEPGDDSNSPHTSGRGPQDNLESELLEKPVDYANITVVVPTYNEAENLPVMTDRLFALGLPNIRMVVVDDSSPDGTAEVAQNLSKGLDGRVDVIKRDSKQGLGTAYVRGFAYALDQGADYILQMDADLSHAPEYIPDFLKKLQDSDVVVGSRYTKGGGVDANWSRRRRVLSSLANTAIRKASGLKVKDVTSGFKAYRKSALVALNLSEFQCKGFGFQAEVAYACQQHGYRITEHPIIFFDRTEGQSKMSISIILEAFWKLILLRMRK